MVSTLRPLLFIAVSLVLLGLVIACGGSSEQGAAAADPTEVEPQDTPVAVTERAETATPSIATSAPAEIMAQTPTTAPVPSATSAPTVADPTATLAAATKEVAATATTASGLATETAEPTLQATQAPPTAAPDPTATRTAPTEAPEETATAVVPERDFDVITLLAPDAIPALDSPGYYDTTEQADESYHDDDLVLGIELNGDARAFSVPLLSRHEIVNDVIGGEPVAVTW